MSIEKHLAELCNAVLGLTAVTKDLMALRSDALEQVKDAGTTGSKSTAKTEPKTEAKTEAKTEPKTEAKTEAKTEPKTEAKTKADDASIHEELKGLVAKYIGDTEREEERTARKGKVKALLNHEKIKKSDVESATSTSHIREDALELFKKNILGLIDKGDITQPAAADDDILG